jgi:hypothetical protein
VQPRCRFSILAGLRQDCASQPVQLRLIVAHGGRCGGSIQCGEGLVEVTGLSAGFRDKTEPLGVEQVGTGLVQAGQAGIKLRDALCLLTEADRRKAPA